MSQACDYKRDAIGGNDDIVVLAAKEDREKISSLLSIVFNDTLLTPLLNYSIILNLLNQRAFQRLKLRQIL